MIIVYNCGRMEKLPKETESKNWKFKFFVESKTGSMLVLKKLHRKCEQPYGKFGVFFQEEIQVAVFSNKTFCNLF
jgi:hypothetical protein